MKPFLYKVETYIVPEVNKFSAEQISSHDKIEDIQLTCQSRIIDENASERNLRNSEDASSYGRGKCVKSTEYFVQNSKLTDANIVESLMSNRETVYDKQLEDDDFKYQNDEENHYTRIEKYLNLRKVGCQTLIKSQDSFYPVRQFKRVNSLTSIDERSESSSNGDSKLNDLCRHGYKNGCTATIPSPEEVSEEIFQENWLRKIETLRQRETAVLAKEIDLQNRERQLFRKEKDVRILERLLQNKLRQMEREQQQLEQRNMNRKLKEVGRKLKSELHEPQEKDHSLERGERPSVVVQASEPARAERPRIVALPVDSCEKIKELEKKPRYLARSKSHSSKSSSNRFSSYGSMRFKERPKVSNDDLNSTLSADPGDSSFVKTSERFNPEVYKKPYAFIRSASERWNKHQNHTIISKVQAVPNAKEKLQEEKVLRKLSENINATQDKDTKFQNYGLVDCKPDKTPAAVTEHNPTNEEKFSYLDLATNKKPSSRRKDRPVSWNDRTNEWLQKKRQAYNLATKEKSAENKENIQCNISIAKQTKNSKVKNKIFTMFR